MSDTNTRECMVAARMTCLRHDASGIPPVVTCIDEPRGDSMVAMGKNAGAAEVADVVVQHVESTGDLPSSLSIGDVTLGVRSASDVNSSQGRATGAVALVTGAAQGFGRGITEALAREGALVCVVDLNAETGKTFVEELRARHGEGAAIFCEADVTDLESMEAAAAVAVDAFGGIDLLVSNAGILKAGGIEEMDVDSFDAVNAVNYKGFFIAVKAVTPFMKLQHAHNRDHFMDIAQINSKSGIEGSNRNFAYAGSKFGSIGLVQSFALELIGSNIKVNAICPGNYFDGPLWSDPEEGLFVQYLAAGKIPGATTLDEVKDFYISKVPMKRGCLPEDVVTALLYLRDQQYETGQALPVTGGQIMLK